MTTPVIETRCAHKVVSLLILHAALGFTVLVLLTH